VATIQINGTPWDIAVDSSSNMIYATSPITIRCVFYAPPAMSHVLRAVHSFHF